MTGVAQTFKAAATNICEVTVEVLLPILSVRACICVLTLVSIRKKRRCFGHSAFVCVSMHGEACLCAWRHLRQCDSVLMHVCMLRLAFVHMLVIQSGWETEVKNSMARGGRETHTSPERHLPMCMYVRGSRSGSVALSTQGHQLVCVGCVSKRYLGLCEAKAQHNGYVSQRGAHSGAGLAVGARLQERADRLLRRPRPAGVGGGIP